VGELKVFFNKNLIEAGCDEAGRGCLAGPVVAASVILPKTFKNKWINDSKQLTLKKRNELRIIIENESLAWKVEFIDHVKIDEINILNASILAMQNAAFNLKIKPELLLIDGNRFHSCSIPHHCFVKGDARFLAIAAASILAKTHRDEYLLKLHEEFPVYNWRKNFGYPTLEHRIAIENYGISIYHRKTFKVKNVNQMTFDF
jgi:ribonuclease HII